MHSSYTTEIYSAIHQIPADTWNALIWHPQASPFIRHAYLLAMENEIKIIKQVLAILPASTSRCHALLSQNTLLW